MNKLKAKYSLEIDDLDRIIFTACLIITILYFLGASSQGDPWLALGWFIAFVLVLISGSIMVFVYWVGIYVNVLIIQDERETQEKEE